MKHVAILGGGPAGMLAALIAHKAGLRVHWVTGSDDAPQTPHIHILRDEIVPLLGKIDTRLEQLIRAQMDHDHLWRMADSAPRRASCLTRAGLLAALRARLQEDDLTPLMGQMRDMRLGPCSASDVLWIDATGGARALARALEDQGAGQLLLDDIGTSTLWQTRFWPDHPAEQAFTYVVPGRAYANVSQYGLRITGCGKGFAMLPEVMVPRQIQAAMTWRFIAPPVRRARWKPKAGQSNLLLLGDALLQTPPDMGFGLLGVAQQACLLSQALNDHADPIAQSDEWADGTWSVAGLQAAMRDCLDTHAHA